MKFIAWPKWLLQAVPFASTYGAPAQAKPPLHVIVSVDVETSVGWESGELKPTSIEQSILGLHDGKYYGIDLIMEMLEKHGMRGTFFVNSTLDSAYPISEVKTFVHRIVARGHDVELHLHPEFRCLRLCAKSDGACWRQCTREVSRLAGNTYEAQLALLIEGARNIEEWGGGHPVAFRAGSFRADETTLKALDAIGIRLDSSMKSPSHVLAANYPVNRVAEHNGVIEVPMYVFRDSLVVKERDKFADIESLSLLDLKRLVRTAQRNDMRTAVFILHSFSFWRGPAFRPNHQSVQIFNEFLSFLRADAGVRVITFRQLAQQYRHDPSAFVGKGAVATFPYWMVLYRSFARFGYSGNNRKFALANVALVLLLVVIALWARAHT